MCAVFISLAVSAFLNEPGDFLFHTFELVVSFNEFHGSCDPRVSMHRVIVVLSDNCFLQFFWYFVGDVH